jgi:hypothetical protein
MQIKFHPNANDFAGLAGKHPARPASKVHPNASQRPSNGLKTTEPCKYSFILSCILLHTGRKHKPLISIVILLIPTGSHGLNATRSRFIGMKLY